MSSAVAVSSAPETKWTVVRGPMKGVVRLMSQAQFTIGRSTECDFVIVNDPKCSRKHVTILVTPQGCEAISQNEKNLLLINGKEVEHARLRDGDILTLGETEVQFNATSAARRMDAPIAMARPGHPMYPQPNAQPPPRRPRRAKGGSARLVIYFVIGLFFLWIFTAEEGKKKPTIDIRTDQKIEADIEAATKLKEQAEVQAAKRLDQSVTSRQAQENYVRGFRDYRKGQYERAITQFQACLALNPEHVLCNRYIRLAQRKFNELIQYEVLLGRKYRDQNQFRSCMAAFKNVMSMVKDANSPIYKEAKANFDACNSFVEGRF